MNPVSEFPSLRISVAGVAISIRLHTDAELAHPCDFVTVPLSLAFRRSRHFMLQIDPHTGLLSEAVYHPSPNCDDRPSGVEPELLVVHSISLPPGEYGGAYVRDFFQNKLAIDVHPYFQEIAQLKVSAHVLIGRNGDLCQFVPFHQRAWHAGVSSFEGREKCNDFSIGIELEGTDHTPFCTIQYWKLAMLVKALRSTYLSMDSCPITGHSDIAPGRKSDPGTGFEWSKLRRLLAAINGQFV